MEILNGRSGFKQCQIQKLNNVPGHPSPASLSVMVEVHHCKLVSFQTGWHNRCKSQLFSIIYTSGHQPVLVTSDWPRLENLSQVMSSAELRNGAKVWNITSSWGQEESFPPNSESRHSFTQRFLSNRRIGAPWISLHFFLCGVFTLHISYSPFRIPSSLKNTGDWKRVKRVRSMLLKSSFVALRNITGDIQACCPTTLGTIFWFFHLLTLKYKTVTMFTKKHGHYHQHPVTYTIIKYK